MFGESVCFLRVRSRYFVVIEGDGLICGWGWLFVVKAIYCSPEYVCVSFVVPVALEVGLPDVGFVRVIFGVDLLVQVSESRVCRVVGSDLVSAID